MKLPRGTLVAESKDPIPEILKKYSQGFKGCIAVSRENGSGGRSEGFILIEDGNVISSAYSTIGITFYQLNALERIMALNDTVSEIYAYTGEEREQLLRQYPNSLIVTEVQKKSEEIKSVMEAEEAKPPIVEGSYDRLLKDLVNIPSVIAAALVVDGFPIFQYGGQVDFEHIAVATEDMVRAGARIATELQLGRTEQIIIETPEYKVIIAPISDMFLCVLTSSNANLGLARLMIKNAQVKVKDV